MTLTSNLTTAFKQDQPTTATKLNEGTWRYGSWSQVWLS